MSLFTSLGDAVTSLVRPSMSIAIEGFGQRIPFAATRELLRRRVGDLHLIRMGVDVVGDQLIGAGQVAKLTFSWSGNPGYGSLHRFRDAVERGYPRPIELIEYSHGSLLLAYRAGAARESFTVSANLVGSELVGTSPALRAIACPFSGAESVAIRAVRPDLAIIHAQRADRSGAVEMSGVLGAEKYAAYASASVLVTVEEVVDRIGTGGGDMIPAGVAHAIAVVPGGARPSGVPGFYDRDDGYYERWAAISANRSDFDAWHAAQ